MDIKHYIFIVLIGIGWSASMAQTGNVEEPVTPDVELIVTVKGQPAGTGKLVGVYADQNFLADTTLIDANGTMVFKKDKRYDEGLYYVLLPDKTSFQVLLTKDQHFEMITEKSSLTPGMQVKGSLENELLYKNLKFQSELEPKFAQVNSQIKSLQKGTPEYISQKKTLDSLLNARTEHVEWFKKNYPKAFFTTYKVAGQNPPVEEPKKLDGTIDTAMQVYLYRTKFWDGVDFTDDRLLHTPVFHNKLNRYIKELTPQHPDSLLIYAEQIIGKTRKTPDLFKYTVNYAALQYRPTKTTLMDGEKVYSQLILKYWTPEIAFWSDSTEIVSLRSQARQMVNSYLGMKGQDIRAKDKNGIYRSLYDSKATLLIFYVYSPNCEHCIEETPQLIKLYHEWKDRGVDVFSLVTNTKDQQEWIDFNNNYGIPWPDVHDPQMESKFYLKYNIDITPEIYVLDKDRIIVAKNLNPSQLPEVLDRELKKYNK